nr:hypothetical protein BDOA9_0204430 [Bradyrhizobium sp. DOA9]
MAVVRRGRLLSADDVRDPPVATSRYLRNDGVALIWLQGRIGSKIDDAVAACVTNELEIEPCPAFDFDLVLDRAADVEIGAQSQFLGDQVLRTGVHSLLLAGDGEALALLGDVAPEDVDARESMTPIRPKNWSAISSVDRPAMARPSGEHPRRPRRNSECRLVDSAEGAASFARLYPLPCTFVAARQTGCAVASLRPGQPVHQRTVPVPDGRPQHHL